MRILGISASALALSAALAGGLYAQSLARGNDGAAPVRAEKPAANQDGFVVAYRRLTESQYRHAIADAFGPKIEITARFEPEQREQRMQAVGNARQSITTSGLEQYYGAARSIARQVIEDEGKSSVALCEPGALSGESCARRMVDAVGPILLRRPLSKDDADRYLAIYQTAVKGGGEHHFAAQQMLVSLLMSPEFLFRVERAERDPDTRGAYRLDSYSKAERISYLLWDSGPDAELLAAAQSGAIQTPAGLAAQVDRMLASPRVGDGVRAFFSDLMEFEYFDSLSKDQATYPKFSQAVAASAREETLRFLVDQLVTRDGDYRDIFTSRETMLNRTLAYVYNVPYLSAAEWSPYTFSEDSGRSGVISQVTFLSLFAHPSASSPTIRGQKIQEIFRCLQVPAPPPNVDFSKVQALENGTVRERLTDHMSNEGCSGCHQLMDPIGLTLERFDGLGQRRMKENGALIDVISEINGQKVDDARGVGQLLHDDPATSACLVEDVHLYGVGRPLRESEKPYLARQTAAFANSGYRLKALYRNILTDPAFFTVSMPDQGQGASQTAQLGN